MSKFTPGPWTLREYTARDSFGWVVRISSGQEIDINAFSDESEGNARLIASAPELLKALELLLAEHREFCDGGALPAEDVAREAIRKAKGEG